MDEPIKTHGFISQLTIKVALKMATRNPESYEQYCDLLSSSYSFIEKIKSFSLERNLEKILSKF